MSKARPRNNPALLGGPYPLIQTGEVTAAELYIDHYENTYSELGLAQSKMWPKGTLCITIAANIAQTAILGFEACFPDSVVGFVSGERVTQIYIHYWFGFFQKILEEQAPQVAQKNINLKILSELDVMVPPMELQQQFIRLVEQSDKSKFIVLPLEKPCNIRRFRLSNPQTVCTFPCFFPYGLKQGKDFYSPLTTLSSSRAELRFASLVEWA